MRYIAIWIILALLVPTVVGQSIVVSDDVAQIRQFVAQQPIGQKLYVYPKTAAYRIGILAKIDAEGFEITVGKRVERFAYSVIAGVAVAQGPQGITSEKGRFWKRVGQGLQTAGAIAFIGPFLLVFYPAAKVTGGFANAKAKVLKKELAKALPTGSSKSQVIAFLDSRKIEHSEEINQIEGSISRGFGYYINLTFRFDEKDRLLDSKVSVSQVADCL